MVDITSLGSLLLSKANHTCVQCTLLYNHHVKSHNCHILNVTTHGNDDEHDNGDDGDDET